MENKNKVVKSEKKLNINYLVFIKKLVESKLEVKEVNKEKIIELYKEVVNKRFSNIKRVDNRVKREEIKDKFNSKILDLNLNEKDFNKVSEKVVLLSKEVKINNYI